MKFKLLLVGITLVLTGIVQASTVRITNGSNRLPSTKSNFQSLLNIASDNYCLGDCHGELLAHSLGGCMCTRNLPHNFDYLYLPNFTVLIRDSQFSYGLEQCKHKIGKEALYRILDKAFELHNISLHQGWFWDDSWDTPELVEDDEKYHCLRMAFKAIHELRSRIEHGYDINDKIQYAVNNKIMSLSLIQFAAIFDDESELAFEVLKRQGAQMCFTEKDRELAGGLGVTNSELLAAFPDNKLVQELAQACK